jgi:ornithine carbamoyltransferase
MPINFKGRNLLTMLEYTSNEIDYIISLAIDLKKSKNQRIFQQNLKNRNFALIFDKPSCRTRTSFIVAATDEGAHLEIFPKEDIRFGIKESIKDIARVLGRMFDGIAYRGDNDTLIEIAKYSGVPVWNGLCNKDHPTQVLADLMTIKEKFGRYQGVKMAYVGDGRNNVANSLIIGSLKMGIDFRIVSPKQLQPSQELVDELKEKCLEKEELKGRVLITDDIKEGLEGCDAVYGDVWVSMGEEHLIEERISQLKNYKVTTELMSMTGKKDTVYLHCLPALHDDNTEMSKKYPDVLEVSDEVFESANSLVFDQSENRMHTIKAVMVCTV